ncbi:FecR domain-containing protein [Mucilaginibacter sp. RS28]|uniref:FecR domain-containing protein n=1 Tax=Mucilaginibacter straminoryzae TaxID=2932774 RepID=A0A9X2B8U8_9SPHI|nr:FecR family protein [Mucilaginibacter straminoryzae]MCJ8209761.1 FecR domain-containing protein [Mucilaginibacter straminoryzae]
MTEKSERLNYLFKQYANNSCTPAELLELMRLTENSDDELLQTMFEQVDFGEREEAQLPDETEREQLFREVVEVDRRQRYLRVYKWTAAAAAAIVIAGASIIWWNNRSAQKEVATQMVSQIRNEVQPGSNKAVLTLANGRNIVLSPSDTGLLASQGNANIRRVDSGTIVYQPKSAPTDQVFYNTVTTPLGGQFQVVLSDGSRVWLNAESSIRYPNLFAGDERAVEITGEAYFEVSHNASKPFRVHIIKANHTPGGTVEVLGTHFNINAYDDEANVRTTLLQGRVRVQQNNLSAILAPGQQSVLDAALSKLTVSKADTDQVIAWKKGYFQFEHADIKQVMRQLSRWYNVEVEFQGSGENHDKFGGVIMRDAPLSQVLRTLEISMVHFKLDGHKVTVFY